MKTPDMAKENNFVLREAAKAASDGYYTHLSVGGKGDPAEERWIEALIAGADAITQVSVLEQRLAQAERERDAAVDDARGGTTCDTCKHNNNKDYLSKPCYECNEAFNCWEWRGICEENSKEERQ